MTPGKNLLAILALFIGIFVLACGQEESVVRPVDSNTTQAPAPANTTASITGELGVPDGIEPYGIMVFAEGTSLMGLTDAEGRYTVAGLTPGEYRFRAMRPDLQSQDLGTITVTASSVAAPQPFQTLLRTIMDQKRGPDGAPVKAGGALGNIIGTVKTLLPNDQASVTVTLEGTRQRTVTVESGEFELLNVEPGDYRLIFSKTGYESVRVPVQVTGGQDTRVPPVEMGSPQGSSDQARTIFGQVTMLLANGETTTDFSGTRVVLEGTSYITTPDAGGRYEFRNIPPATYIIGADASGFILEQKYEINLQFVPAVELDLSLVEDTTVVADKSSIYGRIILEDEPPQGASGVAVSLAGTSLISFTNALGEYEILNIEPGTYDVVAMFSGYKTGYIERADIQGTDPIQMPDLTLESDVVRPTVVATNPAAGARDVPIAAPTTILVQFSQPMNLRSVIDAITVEPAVAFTVLAGSSGPGAQDTVRIEMQALPGSGGPPLKYRTKYTVTVADSAENSEGVTMKEPYEFNIQTGSAMVIATDPADGSKDGRFNFDEPIRVYFNAPINEESITADDVTFRPSLTGNPNVYFRNDPATGWSVMFIQALGEADVNYSVTISRGGKTISGQRVQNLPYRFGFKTRPLRTYDEVYGTGDKGYDVRERERDRHR